MGSNDASASKRGILVCVKPYLGNSGINCRKFNSAIFIMLALTIPTTALCGKPFTVEVDLEVSLPFGV